MPPLEIQVLMPSRRKPPGTSRAVMPIAATSDPASGSDSAKPVRCLPPRGPGSQRARCSGVPNKVIAPVPNPCIANAKSASAPCRANISRARQSERRSKPAIPRYGEIEPARITHRRHQPAAGGVKVVVIAEQRRQLRRRPCLQPGRQLAVTVLEPRPGRDIVSSLKLRHPKNKRLQHMPDGRRV